MRHFLNLPHSYGLMLNVDWFKPFNIETTVPCDVHGLNELTKTSPIQKRKCDFGWNHTFAEKRTCFAESFPGTTS